MAHPKNFYRTMAPLEPVEDVSARSYRRGVYRNGAKRLFDFTVVLLSAPFLVPLVLFMAFLVKCGGGDAFYRSTRVGRHGRSFSMLKLCTMVPNADEVLAAHLAARPEAAQEWEIYQKLKDDPRITPLGHFLRRTSFDELPQLWNVLVGDMSLVGPRPMMPDQRDMYPGHDYYELRPGVTGTWQVSDRNTATFADRARFDKEYSEDLSFTGDLSLIMKTVRVVFKGTGY